MPKTDFRFKTYIEFHRELSCVQGLAQLAIEKDWKCYDSDNNEKRIAGKYQDHEMVARWPIRTFGSDFTEVEELGKRGDSQVYICITEDEIKGRAPAAGLKWVEDRLKEIFDQYDRFCDNKDIRWKSSKLKFVQASFRKNPYIYDFEGKLVQKEEKEDENELAEWQGKLIIDTVKVIYTAMEADPNLRYQMVNLVLNNWALTIPDEDQRKMKREAKEHRKMKREEAEAEAQAEEEEAWENAEDPENFSIHTESSESLPDVSASSSSGRRAAAPKPKTRPKEKAKIKKKMKKEFWS